MGNGEGPRVTRREFAKQLGLGGMAALAGCGGEAPTFRLPLPSLVRPEWWGARGDGLSDDGPAFIAMLREISHGTTLWLSEGRTYVIFETERMETEPERRILKITGLRNLRITGGGTLKRRDHDPAHSGATLLYLGDCISPVVENVRIDGNRVAGGNVGVHDVLVFNQCTGPRVSGVRVDDSTRHGINFTRCTDVRWSGVVVQGPRRYGISHDRCQGIVGSDLVCTGSAERAAVEFTNGCSDWFVERVQATDCLLGGLLIGQHQAEGQSNLNGTVAGLTVRGGQRGITIQGDSAAGNFNEDIRIRDVEVRDVTEWMVSVGNGRRVHLSDFRLVQEIAEAVPGVAIREDTGQITLERGVIQGCGSPVDADRAGEVALREVDVRGCRQPIRFQGCDRVTAHDLRITGSRSAEGLFELTESAVPVDTTLADFRRIVAQDNASPAARFAYGSGRVLRRLVWLDNLGLTMDIHRPDGTEPIEEIVTTPEAAGS